MKSVCYQQSYNPDFIHLCHSLWFKMTASNIGIELLRGLKLLLQLLQATFAQGNMLHIHVTGEFLIVWLYYCL